MKGFATTNITHLIDDNTSMITEFSGFSRKCIMVGIAARLGPGYIAPQLESRLYSSAIACFVIFAFLCLLRI